MRWSIGANQECTWRHRSGWESAAGPYCFKVYTGRCVSGRVEERDQRRGVAAVIDVKHIRKAKNNVRQAQGPGALAGLASGHPAVSS